MSFDPMAPLGAHVEPAGSLGIGDKLDALADVQKYRGVLKDDLARHFAERISGRVEPLADPATTADARRQALERFWSEQERYQIEAHAWELLMTLVSRGEPVIDVARCFDDAEAFAAEAAKRRGAK